MKYLFIQYQTHIYQGWVTQWTKNRPRLSQVQISWQELIYFVQTKLPDSLSIGYEDFN